MMHIGCDKFYSLVLKCAKFVQAMEGVACVLGECGLQFCVSPVARKLVNQIDSGFRRGCWRWGSEGLRCLTSVALGRRAGQRSDMRVYDLCYTVACGFYSVILYSIDHMNATNCIL